VARWTDTTSYANLPAPDDADLLPIADVSAAEGSRQRTITWGQLVALAAAGATVDTVDPTSADDETAGYSVGSLWYNETSGALFICTDETSSGAVWEEISTGGGSALATITAYAANASLHETNDLGAYVRVTAEATITLPDGYATGWQCTIVNATSAADVDLSATTTLTLPEGFTEFIVNRRAVTVIHVGSNVWEVHGALVEKVGS
jgi:hypothetical protein